MSLSSETLRTLLLKLYDSASDREWTKSRSQSRSFSYTKNAWGNCEERSRNRLFLNRSMLSIRRYSNIFCIRYLLYRRHRCSSIHIITPYKRMITNLTKLDVCRLLFIFIDFPCRELRWVNFFFSPSYILTWKIDAKICAWFCEAEPFDQVYITGFPVRHKALDAHPYWKGLLLWKWMTICNQWLIKCKSVWILNDYDSVLCHKIIWKFI